MLSSIHSNLYFYLRTGFPVQILIYLDHSFVCISHLSYASHILHPTFPPLFYHPDIDRRIKHIMNNNCYEVTSLTRLFLY